MKRGIWIGLLAAAAFVVIVIANMPATWVIPAGRTQGLCASIDGSLWSGSCTGLTVSGKPMGDLNWDLHPLRLLTGKLAAHLQLVNGPATVNTDVELGFGGRVTARNLSADLPLDPSLLPLVPPSIAGSAHLDLALVRLEHGIIKELRGKIEAHNIEDRQGADTPLGSYVISFAGGEGMPTGQIRDLDGPLAMEGTLKLTPQPGFELEGLVAPRKGAPPEIINNIRFFGSPDASGRRPFSLSGTF